MMKYRTQTAVYCIPGMLVLVMLWPARNAVAQTTKDSKTIIINNSDTLVNGTNIRQLSKAAQDEVRSSFADMDKKLKSRQVEIGRTGIMVADGDHAVIAERIGRNALPMHDIRPADSLLKKNYRFQYSHPGAPRVFSFNGDSLATVIYADSSMVKYFTADVESRMPVIRMPEEAIAMPNSMRRGPRLRTEGRVPGATLRSRNNSQAFHYSSTDKEGITTSVSILLSDASGQEKKQITGADSGDGLTPGDLIVFPNFSSGKLTVSFNLAAKGAVTVKLLDSDRKPLFTDRVTNFNGNYTRQVALPRNGNYYLVAEQNGKWFVRHLLKEQ